MNVHQLQVLNAGRVIKKLLIVILFLKCANAVSQNNAFPLQGAIWRTKNEGDSVIKISVCWDNPMPHYENYMKVVEMAVRDSWGKHGNIEFTDWSKGNSDKMDIHIQIKDTTPHTIALGSNLRNKDGGVVLNFDFEKWSKGRVGSDTLFYIKAIAIHEFGHVLGFAHENNRNECKFNNCLGEKQGEEGDWTVFPCDSSSVMNYCNKDKKYFNDGYLSDGDKIAVQSLYGFPLNNKIEENSLRLVCNYSIIKPKKGDEISYKFRVYIAGSPKELAKIVKVIYWLDPNWFINHEISIEDRNSNFGIGINAWDDGFHVVAYILLNTGGKYFESKVFAKYLTF
jgi:hypothetical protein